MTTHLDVLAAQPSLHAQTAELIAEIERQAMYTNLFFGSMYLLTIGLLIYLARPT